MSVSHSQAAEFVESLRDAVMPSDDLVNIYDDVHDPHGWRRTRLMRWLTLPRESGPLVLFVGEAPGRDGAAVTGVPFASVETLTQPGYERLHGVHHGGGFAAIGGGVAPLRERTAKAFWTAALPLFDGLPSPVVWNIVPFWPHSSGGNRTPRAHELSLGSSWTERVLKMWEFDAVVSVGRSAQRGLDKAGVANAYVRHPARGGATEFATGIKDVLNELQR